MLLWSLGCVMSPPERGDLPRSRDGAEVELVDGVCPAYSGLHTNTTYFHQTLEGSFDFETQVVSVTGDPAAPEVEVSVHETEHQPDESDRECTGTWLLRCDGEGLWLLSSSFDCTSDEYRGTPKTVRKVTAVDWGAGLNVVHTATSANWVAGDPKYTMSWSSVPEVGTRYAEDIDGAGFPVGVRWDEIVHTGDCEVGGATARCQSLSITTRDFATSSHAFSSTRTSVFADTGWWLRKHQHETYGPAVVDGGTGVATVEFTP